MYIRCWGSRGSIPVSGSDFNKYGGDTTCIEIRSSDNQLIIVDAGTGIRLLGEKIIRGNEKNITLLFTHAHWDHISGFPFFKPLYKRGTTINILSCSFDRSSVRDIFDTVMSRPFFPVQLDDKDIKAQLHFKEVPKHTFKLGTLRISSIPLSHPKDSGLGYRFEEKGRSFVFLTDNELGHVHPGGCTFEEYLDFSKEADLLIHDAEYEQKEYLKIIKFSEERWGHSVVSDVIQLATEANVSQLGLFHINAMRTDSMVDAMVVKAREGIAKRKKNISCFAVGSSFETNL